MSGDYGAAQFAAGYELTKYGANTSGIREVADKDGSLVFVGGNYNFEVVRVYAEAQYFEGLSGIKNAYKFANQGKAGFDGLKGLRPPSRREGSDCGRYFDGRPLLCRCQGRLDRGCRSGLQVLRRFRPLRLPAQQAYERLRGAGYGQTSVDNAAANGSDQDTKLVQAYVGLSHTF